MAIFKRCYKCGKFKVAELEEIMGETRQHIDVEMIKSTYGFNAGEYRCIDCRTKTKHPHLDYGT